MYPKVSTVKSLQASTVVDGRLQQILLKNLQSLMPQCIQTLLFKLLVLEHHHHILQELPLVQVFITITSWSICCISAIMLWGKNMTPIQPLSPTIWVAVGCTGTLSVRSKAFIQCLAMSRSYVRWWITSLQKWLWNQLDTVFVVNQAFTKRYQITWAQGSHIQLWLVCSNGYQKHLHITKQTHIA